MATLQRLGRYIYHFRLHSWKVRKFSSQGWYERGVGSVWADVSGCGVVKTLICFSECSLLILNRGVNPPFGIPESAESAVV